MSKALAAIRRKIVFQICDWGVDFPSAWAPKLGNSWRITNDIIPAYKTVSRILNQAVPQTHFAGPGQWLDLDMLEVGNNVFTIPEEQTHFSLWAIIKSPLIIGAALKDNETSINAGSLAILKNPSIINYNRDRLGIAAGFRRRWTEEGYELWGGPLSGSGYVAAVINLFDTPQDLTLNLPDVGFQTAGTLNDIWNGVTHNNVLTSYTATVQAHGVLLVELSDTTPVNSYDPRFTSACR
jgi:alpha-galactosidase